VQPTHLVGEVRAHVSPIACVASDHLPVRAELSEGRR
jgi:endonuclease/exonuclease/phosphatase family metal-dependent hydrolase